MAPASDNNNQDLATKKAKLDSTSTVLGGVGKCIQNFCFCFDAIVSAICEATGATENIIFISNRLKCNERT